MTLVTFFRTAGKVPGRAGRNSGNAKKIQSFFIAIWKKHSGGAILLKLIGGPVTER